jgi:hypothetical protein
MTASLTIKFSNEVLDALVQSRSITILLVSSEGDGKAARAAGSSKQPSQARTGSLPSRVITWAEKRGSPFRNTDVEKRFKLSRAHASMLTSKLAGGRYPIRRLERGVYQYSG